VLRNSGHPVLKPKGIGAVCKNVDNLCRA
jgi:hypothetical protein